MVESRLLISEFYLAPEHLSLLLSPHPFLDVRQKVNVMGLNQSFGKACTGTIGN